VAYRIGILSPSDLATVETEAQVTGKAMVASTAKRPRRLRLLSPALIGAESGYFKLGSPAVLTLQQPSALSFKHKHKGF
jgi:hypothetical protein